MMSYVLSYLVFRIIQLFMHHLYLILFMVMIFLIKPHISKFHAQCLGLTLQAFRVKHVRTSVFLHCFAIFISHIGIWTFFYVRCDHQSCLVELRTRTLGPAILLFYAVIFTVFGILALICMGLGAKLSKY